MSNYEVGDTVEELDTGTGVVVDTGVVTRVEKYHKDYQMPEDVRKIYAKWENDLRLPELSFSSADPMFRNKVKRKVEPEITLETVSKVLLTYSKRDTERGRHSTSQLMLIAEEIFQSLQADQQELQRQNDPEYQKYLELKKKFNPE